MQIRAHTPDHYDTIAAIYAAIHPRQPLTAGDLRAADQALDPKHKTWRWVSEIEGRVVGAAHCWQPPMFYNPHNFNIDIAVVPDVQGQGIGKALYDHILTALAPFNPRELITEVSGDPAYPHASRAIRFLGDRGFTEMGRMWESSLDVNCFDGRPYRAMFERLAREGIRILSLVELIHDPIRYRRVYDLEMALVQDVPTGNPVTLDFEAWVQDTLANPQLIPEAYLLAMHGGGYVAMSTLWGSPGDTVWTNKLTAVKADYRRRGIALALKIRGIEIARKRGIQTITTWNAAGNEGMDALNAKLGFVQQPGIITFKKIM